MLKRILRSLTLQGSEARRAELYRNLIRHEAKIGGSVFGPVPKGHRREFFCLDPNTWVWHEEWIDAQGTERVQTTRYDVRPSGILKAQGNSYQQISHEEAYRLYNAAKLYQQKINTQMYAGVR